MPRKHTLPLFLTIFTALEAPGAEPEHSITRSLPIFDVILSISEIISVLFISIVSPAPQRPHSL
jgi:hypothetical protein